MSYTKKNRKNKTKLHKKYLKKTLRKNKKTLKHKLRKGGKKQNFIIKATVIKPGAKSTIGKEKTKKLKKIIASFSNYEQAKDFFDNKLDYRNDFHRKLIEDVRKKNYKPDELFLIEKRPDGVDDEYETRPLSLDEQEDEDEEEYEEQDM